jgi:hypothetical protein
MSRETELKNFLRKAKTRKRLGLKSGTSIGPAGASIVSDDGMRLKNTSGDPNKKLKTLGEIMKSIPKGGASAGVTGALTKAIDELQERFPNKRLNKDDFDRLFKQKGQPTTGSGKPKLEEEVDIPDVPVKKGEKPNMGQVAGGFKTLNVKKGGLIKKKKKKSKMAGRLAKRGYGAARK